MYIGELNRKAKIGKVSIDIKDNRAIRIRYTYPKGKRNKLYAGTVTDAGAAGAAAGADAGVRDGRCRQPWTNRKRAQAASLIHRQSRNCRSLATTRRPQKCFCSEHSLPFKRYASKEGVK